MSFYEHQKQAADIMFRNSLESSIAFEESQSIKNARTTEAIAEAIARAERQRAANRLLYGWKD